jgi:trans-aconitate methyltransferase
LIGEPSVPTQQEWENEYESGSWERLNALSERAHSAVVLSYVVSFRPASSILELGCGEGILFRDLQKFPYTQYIGVDISHYAIEQCLQFVDDKTMFIADNAETYRPASSFDVIILNESIYYFTEPINTMRRYANYLTKDGVFVLSIYDNLRTRPIRRALKEEFHLVDETAVKKTQGTWHCMALARNLIE